MQLKSSAASFLNITIALYDQGISQILQLLCLAKTNLSANPKPQTLPFESFRCISQQFSNLTNQDKKKTKHLKRGIWTFTKGFVISDQGIKLKSVEK